VATDGITDFPEGEMQTRRYEALSTEQDILVTRVKGPIDAETINSVTRSRFRCIMELDNSKVASIIVFQKSMKVTADALELFSKLLKSHHERINKTIFVAYVVPLDVEDRVVSCQLFEEIYAQNNVAWRAFEKLEDAQTWAKSMLNVSV